MYINREPAEIFKLANLAVSIQFFDNLVGDSIKRTAEEAGVSEKQLHFWKNLLKKEGIKLFSSLKPGRKKENISCLEESEKLLIYETVNRLLVEEKKQEGRNRRFSSEVKQKILHERRRLKQDFSVGYEKFAELVGIDSGSVRLWSRKEKREDLENHSRAPNRRPKKLSPELISKIVWYGSRWKRRHRGRIKLTAFGAGFRWKHRKLLARYGKSNLSDKTIARYLKEADSYRVKEEKHKGKRGAFRYYFPGAQFLIDTTVVKFLGIKAKLISVMDALSRKIFHQEAFLVENAEKVIKSIKCSLSKAERSGLKVLSLVSDHGKPYKAGRVWEYIKGEGIYRIFSPPYWPEGKAPIERYFRTVKEGLSDRWENLIFFIRGIKERIVLGCLNLILIGFNSKYERTSNPYIDGKSPQERIKKGASFEFCEASKKIFAKEERESILKRELIDSVYKEFGFELKKENAVRLLSRYKKKAIDEAAEALRRKLAIEKLAPKNRWFYLASVSSKIDIKDREEKEARAKTIIRQEKAKVMEREERKRIEEERRWYETHPEEALEEAVEWQLVLCGNEFARTRYEKMIANTLKKVLMQHSILTARLKVDRMCKRIEEKDKLENKKVIESKLSLPDGDELKEAKEEIVGLIRESYSQCKKELPAFQGLRQLWRKSA